MSLYFRINYIDYFDLWKFYAEGYIDSVSELDYRHIAYFKEIFSIIHCHDYYEIFLVSKGKLVHVVNHEKIILQQGHLAFI